MTRTAPLLLALLPVLAAGGLAAQDPDTTVVDSALPVPEVRPRAAVGTPQDTATELPASPLGAMVRSMILPGWGQSKFDAYFRGGIYFAGWTGNWFMNFRNAYRLENVQARFDIRSDQVARQLIATSSNPDSMRAQIDSFPSLVEGAVREDSLGNELRKLVRARQQQQEDWIAWSVFWVLASGIDAYVTAHLADFPAEVQMHPGRNRSVTLRVGVPWPFAKPPQRGASSPAPEAAAPAPPAPLRPLVGPSALRP